MKNLPHHILFTIILVLLGAASCNKVEDVKEDEYVENLELKNALEGTWLFEYDNGSYGCGMKQLTFIGDTIYWYDSIVGLEEPQFVNGHIGTTRGTVPVRYTFNDGIQHYSPWNVQGGLYTFYDCPEDDILWVFVIREIMSEVNHYKIIDGDIEFINKEQYYIHEFGSCYVKFSSDYSTADFCIYMGGSISPDLCQTYMRIN